MTTVPGAASTAVQRVLTGPAVAARVLGSHRTCVYLRAGADVVAVETADGAGLPCAVRLGADSATGIFAAVRRGGPATVGDGLLVLGSLTVRAARWWSPRTPRPGRDPQRVAALARALAAHPPPMPPGAAPADLVGRGPGLTPAGDDVLAGMLVGLHHAPAARDRLAGQVLAAAGRRTTALSATLLRLAAAGHGVPALLDLADWVSGRGGPDLLDPLVRRLLAVGHTSGAAMAWGLLVAGPGHTVVGSRGVRGVAAPETHHSASMTTVGVGHG